MDCKTPFRERFARSLRLDLQGQVEECADYLQHPEVLIEEFLESYYLVERELDPEIEDEQTAGHRLEVVLEPFFDSLDLQVQAGQRSEKIHCLAGAFAPLAGEAHPALEHRDLDYVGVRSETKCIVLGVTDPHGETNAFPLLLRALNCLAEIATPFQLTRLRRHVLRDRVDPDGSFDLQIGISSQARSELETSLLVLTRDLAEIFKTRISAEHQFEGAIGRIECLELPENPAASDAALRLRWRV